MVQSDQVHRGDPAKANVDNDWPVPVSRQVDGRLSPLRSAQFYTALAEAGVGAQMLGRYDPELSIGAHVAHGMLTSEMHDRRYEGRRYRPGRYPGSAEPYENERRRDDMEALLSTELPPDSRFRTF
jgi:hypothetical protein